MCKVSGNFAERLPYLGRKEELQSGKLRLITLAVAETRILPARLLPHRARNIHSAFGPGYYNKGCLH